MVAISPGPLCLHSDDSPAVPVRVATRGLLQRGNGVAYKTRFQKVQQEQRIYLDSHVWTPRVQSKIRIVDEAKVKQMGRRAVSVASWKTRYVPHSVEYEPGETRICPSGDDASRTHHVAAALKVEIKFRCYRSLLTVTAAEATATNAAWVVPGSVINVFLTTPNAGNGGRKGRKQAR